jgi:hypothetical protein
MSGRGRVGDGMRGLLMVRGVGSRRASHYPTIFWRDQEIPVNINSLSSIQELSKSKPFR